MGVKPVSPDDVYESIEDNFPDGVITAFNILIAKNCNNGVAVVTQSAAIEAILTEMRKEEDYITRSDVFARHWLDVEPLYRKHGWSVEYEKPDYGSSGDATFTFRRARG